MACIIKFPKLAVCSQYGCIDGFNADERTFGSFVCAFALMMLYS